MGHGNAGIPIPPKPGIPAFTLVFDREAYEPKWFIKLWEQYQVGGITYRKNVPDKSEVDLRNSRDLNYESIGGLKLQI